MAICLPHTARQIAQPTCLTHRETACFHRLSRFALIRTATADQPAARFLSWRGFQVACAKALQALAPQANGTVRILRRDAAMVPHAPWAGQQNVIAPELLDDAAAKLPREDLRTITARIARAHLTRVASTPDVLDIPALVRGPMPSRQRSAASDAPRIAGKAEGGEDLGTITTRIVRKHRASPAKNIPRLLRDGATVRAHLRAVRRKLLARPRTVGTARDRAPAVVMVAEDAIEVTPRDLAVASVVITLVSLAFAAGVTGLSYVVLVKLAT